MVHVAARQEQQAGERLPQLRKSSIVEAAQRDPGSIASDCASEASPVQKSRSRPGRCETA